LKTTSAKPLRAVFLGTADGHTSALRDHSGILLEAAEGHLLLDCGADVAQYLLGKKYSPDVPHAIWLSHMHSDHNGQITSLIQSLWLLKRKATLHFFGPAGVMRAMKEWLERCLLFPDLIGFDIEWHSVKPGKPVVDGHFTLTAFPTDHLNGLAKQFQAGYPDTCFDCYGALVEYAGRRYIYSADLAHPRELAPPLQGGGRQISGRVGVGDPLPRPARRPGGEIAGHRPGGEIRRGGPFDARQGCPRDLNKCNMHGAENLE
jgi:hypothetical protein